MVACTVFRESSKDVKVFTQTVLSATMGVVTFVVSCCPTCDTFLPTFSSFAPMFSSCVPSW